MLGLGVDSSKSPLFSGSDGKGRKKYDCGKSVPMTPPRPRLVVLSNVYDENYQKARAEEIPPCLSSPKRRDLFTAIQLALGWEVVVLSCPPRASFRRHGRWLPPIDTRFDRFSQHVCANWDLPKLRIPFSWLMYAIHVARHARKDDLLMVDNFELIYVLAAWLCRLLYGSRILLDYEDGKHLTDRGWARLISGPAEALGKPLINGAILAHPNLGERLAKKVPKISVPGFYKPTAGGISPDRAGIVRFVYAGSLDKPRGIDLLIGALPHLPDHGWQLDITGAGPLRDSVQRLANIPRFQGKVFFRGVLPAQEHAALLAECHVGLNLQLSSDPISSVTFPSKIFSYFSAGLEVISTEASQVKTVLPEACIYLKDESPDALASLMALRIRSHKTLLFQPVFEKYSVPATSIRLKTFFSQIMAKEL
jgi:glycosyltransferase involved in cell wall biosynthesis